jgi:signal transduction histidine kinase
VTAGAAEAGRNGKTLFPARRRAFLVLFHLALLAAGIGVLFFQSPSPQGGVPLAVARFQPLADLDRPAAVPETTVSLPHSITVPGAGRFGGGLYRFELPRPPDDGEPWSVFIPDYSGRIQVRVNGVLVNDSLWAHSGLSAALTWPDIIPIPAPLLRDDVNTLEIRAVMLVGRKSYLGRVHAGPDRLLRPAYQWRHFLQVTLPQLLFAWQVAFGLLLALLWAVRRCERAALLFAFILLFNAGGSLVLVLPEPLLPPLAAWLSNFSFIWVTALLIPFAFRFVGRRPPAASALLLGLPVGTTLGVLVLPPDVFQVVGWYVAVPSALAMICGAIAVFLDAAFRRGNEGAHVISGTALLSLLIACHDLPMMYGAAGERLSVSSFAIPVFLFLAVTGSVLMWRFAVALDAVDQFNAKLRREIADAEAALRVSLTREQAQEKAITLETERSRLTRDLHDGLAGQLVSMVALSGREDADPRDLGTAARRALADLRLVIASMAEVGDDPGMMLANFRDHIEPQLRALGIALDWRMHVLPEVSGWSSSTVLELFRLLQEATINAARHSGAGLVAIEILPVGDGVRVVIADSGCGGAAERPGGYGLANMRRRAQSIGARLAIESGPGGTCVILDLPRQTGGSARYRI